MNEVPLKFGRDNIGYAVLATHLNQPNEAPVVVSVHLGEKLALMHARQMQGRSRAIKFSVQRVKIGELILWDEQRQLSAEQQSLWQDILDDINETTPVSPNKNV